MMLRINQKERNAKLPKSKKKLVEIKGRKLLFHVAGMEKKKKIVDRAQSRGKKRLGHERGKHTWHRTKEKRGSNDKKSGRHMTDAQKEGKIEVGERRSK